MSTLSENLTEARRLLAAGRTDAAERLFGVICEADPKHVEAHIALGRIALSRGAAEAAARHLHDAIRHSTHRTARMWMDLGLARALARQRVGAVEAFRHAVTLAPHHADAHFNLALALSDAGEPVEACDHYRRAIACAPGHVQAHFNLGNLCRRLGDTSSALAAYGETLRMAPDFADGHNNLGSLLNALGRFPEAIDRFRRAVTFAPRRPDYRNNLANALAALGEADAAEAAYREGLAIDSGHTGLGHNFARFLMRQGRFGEAEAQYRRMLRERSDDAGAGWGLGKMFMARGNMSGAEAALTQAVRRAPENPELLNDLGLVFKARGRIREAMATIARALSIAPEVAAIANNLASLQMDLGNLADAEKLLVHTLDSDPTFAPALKNLALVYSRSGRPKPAETTLRRLIDQCPDDGESRCHLALLVFQAGRLAEATEMFWQSIAHGADIEGLDRILMILVRAGEQRGLFPPDTAPRWHARLATTLPESPLPDLFDLAVSEHGSEADDGTWGRVLKHAAGDDPPQSVPTTILMNFGRSGTGFFHALIDGHPELSTLPGIYFKDFFALGNWALIDDPDPAMMVERFCGHYAVLFDASLPKNVPGNNHPAHFPIGVSEGFTRMGEHADNVLTLDRDAFKHDLIRRLSTGAPVSAGRFFTALHQSMDHCLGRPETTRALFYHIHDPGAHAVIRYLAHFPDTRIFVAVRNPIQSCESWLSKLADDPDGYPEMVRRLVRMLTLLDFVAYRHVPAFGIRLEDLKGEPDRTLEAACRVMGIDFAPTLRVPTMQGLRWWGDPGSVTLGADPFARMTSDPTRRAVGFFFSDSDLMVLKTLFGPFIARFGYDPAAREEAASRLDAVRPLLDRPFDFEKHHLARFADRNAPPETNLFTAYLRSVLIRRWEILKHHGTYRHMLTPIGDAVGNG